MGFYGPPFRATPGVFHFGTVLGALHPGGLSVYAGARVCYVTDMSTETPSLDDVLARVASTSVEDMYSMADEDRARLIRINSNLPEKEDVRDNSR